MPQRERSELSNCETVSGRAAAGDLAFGVMARASVGA
jgi:hypothetical protein